MIRSKFGKKRLDIKNKSEFEFQASTNTITYLRVNIMNE